MIQDIDLIILGGYYGDGKFIDSIKSFLMGVASSSKTPGENPTEFLSVVSVSNGLSMNTLKELWKIFENKWQTERPINVIPPKVNKCKKNIYVINIYVLIYYFQFFRSIRQNYGFVLKILLF